MGELLLACSGWNYPDNPDKGGRAGIGDIGPPSGTMYAVKYLRRIVLHETRPHAQLLLLYSLRIAIYFDHRFPLYPVEHTPVVQMLM
jgi:hypothetical protein